MAEHTAPNYSLLFSSPVNFHEYIFGTKTILLPYLLLKRFYSYLAVPKVNVSLSGSLMKYLYLFLLSFCTLKGQYLWQFYPDTVIKWAYAGGDEFNKQNIDTSTWLIGFPWSRSMFMNDNYVLDNNFAFKEGKAHFLVEKLDTLVPLQAFEMEPESIKKDKLILEDGNKYRFKYSTALLWSKKTYQYGYFEIKFKGVEGRGVWPAFWLYGGNPNYEIDFFELKGEKEKQIHVDVHCPQGCSDFHKGLFRQVRNWGHWIHLNQPLKSGFNIVSGEWGPDYIRWFLNGNLIAYSNQTITRPMNLIVGTGVAKNNGPFKPGPDKKTPFPNHFIVDYIRIFKTDSLPDKNMMRKNMSLVTDTLQSTENQFAVTTKSNRLNVLPKGVTQRIKEEKLITVSCIQSGKNSISLRVLNANENNVAVITFLNLYGEVLDSFSFQKSEEKLLILGESTTVVLQAEANQQSIKQVIQLD